MRIIIVPLLLCFSAAQLIQAKKFDKCSLLHELKRLNVPKEQLADWICVVQYESNFDTKAMNSNSNKSKDWGLFQINDVYWCDPKDGRKSKNVCKLACNELLSDDITKAMHCAQRIREEHKGFSAWVAWNKHCQKSKPDISKC